MRSRNLLVLIIVAAVLVIMTLVFYRHNRLPEQTDESASPPVPVKAYNFEQIQPLPTEISLPEKKLALGQLLFYEPQLSRDNKISCASCHDLDQGGTDRRPTSIGINGAEGRVNALTVFNSSFNFAQFWDGRAATLKEQTAGPIHNPVEMGSNWKEVIAKLRADNDYTDIFKRIYPDGITANNIADAIAIFERSLITPNSRFDRYLRGDRQALTEAEIEGYQRFKSYGCISCHQGINIGANMFQRFGVVKGYFKDKDLSRADLGRFNITGLEEDRHVFKVPGLRNVAITAPYFHDGSIDTLEKVVSIMGLYQLGYQLSDADIRLITAFLHSLTGQWNGNTPP